MKRENPGGAWTSRFFIPESRTNGEMVMHTRTLRIAGVETLLRETGSGPPILLLHGLGANGEYWSDVAPALSSSFRLWIPDLLGHGFSARPPLRYRLADYDLWLENLLEHLAPREPLTLMGNSLGGLLCARYALHHPQRTDRLVLVSAAGLTRPAVPWRTRLLYLPQLLQRRHQTATRDPQRYVPFLVRGVVARREAAPHIARLIVAGSPEEGPSGSVFTRTARALLSPSASLWNRLEELHLPTLLLWGDQDPMFPLALAQNALSRLPRASLAVVSGSGHLPMLEDPEGFLAVLMPWLERQGIRADWADGRGPGV